MIAVLNDKRISLVLRGIACVYAIVLFYFNYIRLFDEALWLDEAYTGVLVRKSIIDGIRMTASDVHPPLYYLIVKAFASVLGMSGPVLHIVSIIPLVIILVFCLTVVWKKFGASVALIIMTMTSISDAAIRFNVEIRMYSWAALFVFLSYYFFYKIISEDENNRDYVLFSVFSLDAAYTHYYALIAVAFFYAILFFRALIFNKDEIKRTLIIIGVAIVVYLPWLFVLVKSLTTRVNNYWITENSSFKECFNFIFSNIFFYWVWIAVVVLAACSVFYMLKRREASDRTILLFVFAGLISVVGTMAVGIGISALLSPFFVTRYIYVVCPVAWMVFGILLSKLRFNWIYTLVFIVWFVYSIIPSYKATYYDDIEVANRTEMVRDIVAGLGEDDVIVTDFVDSTMPEWYFYGHEYMQVTDLQELDLSDAGKNYWFIVGDEWSYDDISARVGEQGYSCETLLDYGLLGHSKILVYRVDRQ